MAEALPGWCRSSEQGVAPAVRPSDTAGRNALIYAPNVYRKGLAHVPQHCQIHR